MSGPKYVEVDGLTVCADCGVRVLIPKAHTRFHSILSAHAWAIAVLKNTHIDPRVHDQYTAYDRINSKRFDSWSADALAEVISNLSENEASVD